MAEFLRRTLPHVWRSLRQRLPGSGAAKVHMDEQGSGREASRARFWAELREGQREAERRCSGPHS